MTDADFEVISTQLGRAPRGVQSVSYRTPDGVPAVVKTRPRLDDGTPFPTLFYLTDPRLTAEASRLEACGIMKDMSTVLEQNEELLSNYHNAHDTYLSWRNELEDLGTDFSGGGMPTRVKCLHVLIAYSLSAGPGVCLMGDYAVALAAKAGLRGSAIPADWPDLQLPAVLPPVGAIDCGTNSIRLLIASPQSGGKLKELDRRMRIVRLGQGVDATGMLSDAAIARTKEALTSYTSALAQHGVKQVRMVATSATRDASNKDDFFSMTSELLGTIQQDAQAEVITGDEEARLSFTGAVTGVDSETGGPFVVSDVGGGSSEVITGQLRDGQITVDSGYSADIGCVRITERALKSDPPTATEIQQAKDAIASQLAITAEKVDFTSVNTWIAVAGTFTTIAAIHLELDSYDAEAIHGTTLTFTQLRAVCEKLLNSTVEQRKAMGSMHPGRADVIGGGALVAMAIADLLEEKAGLNAVTVSETDILDGIALSIAS